MGQGIVLYHGSKGGVHGEIRPDSWRGSDLGPGFYLCPDAMNAWGCARADYAAEAVTVLADLSQMDECKVRVLGGMPWVWTVLAHLRMVPEMEGGAIHDAAMRLAEGADLVVAPMAGDLAAPMLRAFARDEVTDTALLRALEQADLGMQVVAKTQRACACIRVISQRPLTDEEVIAMDSLANSRLEEAKALLGESAGAAGVGRYASELVGDERQARRLLELVDRMTLVLEHPGPRTIRRALGGAADGMAERREAVPEPLEYEARRDGWVVGYATPYVRRRGGRWVATAVLRNLRDPGSCAKADVGTYDDEDEAWVEAHLAARQLAWIYSECNAMPNLVVWAWEEEKRAQREGEEGESGPAHT